MATVTLGGNPFQTVGNLPVIGSQVPDFNLVKSDLSTLTKKDLQGKFVVYNIFPSLDTSTCAASVRRFNKEAAGLDNTVVVCVSQDLPFAHKRFCVAEGIENVITGSSFRDASFGNDFGVRFTNGPLEGLLSRSVVVADENGKVVYTEQVAETANEPDYDTALAALKAMAQ